MRGSIFVVGLFGLLGSACATLADAAGGDENLPNAGAGPFRELKKGELAALLIAPNAVADGKTFARDPAVIDADGDPATFEVIGYFGANASGEEPDAATTRIARTVAFDGRSFERDLEVVLEATEDWEFGEIGAPNAVRVNGEVWLYYAAGVGIGLARSADSRVFTKVDGPPFFEEGGAGPVLGIAETGWDAGATPRSPSVISLGDEGFAMFYEARIGSGKSAIGEARSKDGITWTRVGDRPALVSGEAGEEAYDDAGVGGPFAIAGETALGRPLVRLYYSAESGAGKRTIGMAARFPDGPFERAASPVLGAGTSRGPREPCAIAFEGMTLLFATQDKSGTQEEPVVAAGVAPAQAVLPPVTESD